MRIIAYDRFKPGVTLETVTPYLPEEVANVWRLWKAGIVRENYARADEPSVVIVFELGSVEEAKRYTDDFPLSKEGFLEWSFLSLRHRFKSRIYSVPRLMSPNHTTALSPAPSGEE
jgi:hypothetical protein